MSASRWLRAPGLCRNRGPTQYRVPAEPAAIAFTFQQIGISPSQWIRDEVPGLLHAALVQQREKKQMTSSTVERFIRAAKILPTQKGNPQCNCILCGRQLPVRRMVILCEDCKYIIQGGGATDQLTEAGREIVYFLHQLVEVILSRRLDGQIDIPDVFTDKCINGRILALLSGEVALDILDDAGGAVAPPLPGPLFGALPAPSRQGGYQLPNR